MSRLPGRRGDSGKSPLFPAVALDFLGGERCAAGCVEVELLGAAWVQGERCTHSRQGKSCTCPYSHIATNGTCTRNRRQHASGWHRIRPWRASGRSPSRWQPGQKGQPGNLRAGNSQVYVRGGGFGNRLDTEIGREPEVGHAEVRSRGATPRRRTPASRLHGNPPLPSSRLYQWSRPAVIREIPSGCHHHRADAERCDKLCSPDRCPSHCCLLLWRRRLRLPSSRR